MATYNFKDQRITLTDPQITGAFVNGLHPETLQIDVIITLSLNGVNYKPQLYGVSVNDLNYNEGQLIERIWAYLNNPVNGFIQ